VGQGVYEVRFLQSRPEGGEPRLIDRSLRELASSPKAALADAKRRIGTAAWPAGADGVVILDNGSKVEEWWQGQDDA
jgi:hypothetical protein